MQCSDKPLRLLVVRPVAWVAARSINNAIHLLCPVVQLVAGWLSEHTLLLLQVDELDWVLPGPAILLMPVTLTSPPLDRLGWIVG
jgi:hypothetical protein